MNRPIVRLVRLDGFDPEIALPSYATTGAAGADLRANLAKPDRNAGLTLVPGQRQLVPTGLAMEIAPGFEVQLRPRSGLALKQGLTLVNSPGTIDADYRGPVGVILINHGQYNVTIQHGDRIAQMVVAPALQADFELGQTLDETDRGTGGFGSTGVR